MRLLMVGIVALCLGGLILAQDDTKSGDKSRAERLKALTQETAKAAAELRQATTEAGDDQAKRNEARAKYMATLTKLRPKMAEGALAIAKEDPKDDVGFDALIMAFQTDPNNAKVRAEAQKLIKEHHLANPKIENALPALARSGRGVNKAFLNEVKEKNPSKSVKAFAGFTLAQALKTDATSAQTPDDQILPKLEEAKKAFEAVAEEYGDAEVRSLRGKVSAAVERELADIKNTPIGKVTPEIEGEDVDGKTFKISDYRGKVVLLDFWGHW
jgi:hypothetical protein